MDSILKRLQHNDLPTLQTAAKIITAAMSDEIKDFSTIHLSPGQKRELMRLLRAAVFNSLFAIANFEDSAVARKIVKRHLKDVPDYWKDIQLMPELHAYLNSVQKATVRFKSRFLNKQLLLGNIFFVPEKKCVQILPSDEFTDVPMGAGSLHKSKISTYLRKENYTYDYRKHGYVQRHKEESKNDSPSSNSNNDLTTATLPLHCQEP